MKTISKKHFGQHFLRDKGVLDRIVRFMGPGQNDLVIEIGAGDGALSAHLAPHVGRLLAVEVDIDCLPLLGAVLAPFEHAEAISGDILKIDLAKLISPHTRAKQRLRIAGNLPYNIATAIIERLLLSHLPINDMIFLVQFEVAERVTAKPGTREYGFFSVICQHHSEVQIGFKVSPTCFVPRPKVTSAILILRPKQALWNDPSLERSFRELAKASFGHRRKTLANALRKHPFFGAFLSSLLSRAGIDGTRRAEELTVQEYEHLAEVIQRFFPVECDD